jgi:hypothetical protein
MSTVYPISSEHPLVNGDKVIVHSRSPHWGWNSLRIPMRGRIFTVSGSSSHGYDLSDAHWVFVSKQAEGSSEFNPPWFSSSLDHGGILTAYGEDGLLYVEGHDEPLAGEYLERIEHTS